MAERRWTHALRLVLFVAFLLTLFYLVAIRRVVDIESVRGAIVRSRPIAPLVYLATSAVLAAIFVPGPLLAAGSRVLFGPVLGTFVTLGSTVTTATIAALVGRRAGRDSARALIGRNGRSGSTPRSSAAGYGRSSVNASSPAFPMRWLPIPSAHSECRCGRWRSSLHRIGTARIRLHRAGRVHLDFTSPLAYAAIAVWCITAIVGAFAAHRGYRNWRTHTRQRERPDGWAIRAGRTEAPHRHVPGNACTPARWRPGRWPCAPGL